MWLLTNRAQCIWRVSAFAIAPEKVCGVAKSYASRIGAFRSLELRGYECNWGFCCCQFCRNVNCNKKIENEIPTSNLESDQWFYAFLFLSFHIVIILQKTIYETVVKKNLSVWAADNSLYVGELTSERDISLT